MDGPATANRDNKLDAAIPRALLKFWWQVSMKFGV
jgi:hypothetical protein